MNALKHLSLQWKTLLKPDLKTPAFQALSDFLEDEKQSGKTIYPPENLFFEALNQTSFEDTCVVIVGQDPYHGPNQAHGLSFSVPENTPLPPSLRNIYKELSNDLKVPPPTSGNLLSWAKQGVLLLNSTLSVEMSKAGSHQGKGWEELTDKILLLLNEKETPVVFILWGAFAQKKGAFLNSKKHLVLKSAHPSPLSAYRGFWDSKPFSQTNGFLIKEKQTPIKWT